VVDAIDRENIQDLAGEELVRIVLDALKIIPEGESADHAEDRLSALDSVGRAEIVNKMKAKQNRAKKLREAMAAKRARDAAAKVSGGSYFTTEPSALPPAARWVYNPGDELIQEFESDTTEQLPDPNSMDYAFMFDKWVEDEYRNLMRTEGAVRAAVKVIHAVV